jgi:hypothetical protein
MAQRQDAEDREGQSPAAKGPGGRRELKDRRRGLGPSQGQRSGEAAQGEGSRKRCPREPANRRGKYARRNECNRPESGSEEESGSCPSRSSAFAHPDRVQSLLT